MHEQDMGEPEYRPGRKLTFEQAKAQFAEGKSIWVSCGGFNYMYKLGRSFKLGDFIEDHQRYLKDRDLVSYHELIPIKRKRGEASGG